MQAYQINDIERLTGIKAHTIRIWEKRYGLIKPERTTTNRRYYNDGQVRKLLNVATLLAQGQKISRLASLSENQLNTLVKTETQGELRDNMETGHVNDLVKSMLAFDEAGFEKIFSATVIRLGMYEAMLQIVYPFLNKVGLLWSINQIAVVQEHFATSIIRRKIMSATDGLPAATIATRKFLLFLPPGEWHEMGLLFANYIIRSKGYNTIYLGQNTPVENIKRLIAVLRPDHMVLFYVTTRPHEEVAAQIKAFAAINIKVRVLIAGNAELYPSARPGLKNVTYLKDVSGLFRFL